MPLSQDTRERNFDDALIRMIEDVGEVVLSDFDFDFEAISERYKDIYATTWDELMDRGYIAYRWVDTYDLTVAGWTKGIILLERHKTPLLSSNSDGKSPLVTLPA